MSTDPDVNTPRLRRRLNDPAATTWAGDAAVEHSYHIYENGTPSRVGWDDTGGDTDLNDLCVEIAGVERHAYFDGFVVAAFDEAALTNFTDNLEASRRAEHRHSGE